MKVPEIYLKELEENKKRNFESRLKFIENYVEWLKKTPNKEWSKQQKKLIDSQLKSSRMTKEEFLEMKKHHSKINL